MQNILEWLKPYRLPLVLLVLVIGRIVVFGDARIPVGRIFNLLISPDQNTPQPKIESPVPQASYRQGKKIIFIGHGPTQYSQIQWRSNIDGQFQEGRYTFSYDKLTPGFHTITLIVRCRGRQNSTSVDITVQPP